MAAGSVAQLVESLPSVQEALVSVHSITLDWALLAGNLNTGKVKPGKSEGQCHHWKW